MVPDERARDCLDRVRDSALRIGDADDKFSRKHRLCVAARWGPHRGDGPHDIRSAHPLQSLPSEEGRLTVRPPVRSSARRQPQTAFGLVSGGRAKIVKLFLHFLAEGLSFCSCRSNGSFDGVELQPFWRESR